MQKKVIFGAHFHWDSYLHIGSHQYAKQFARNEYQVAYISESISPFHFLLAKDRVTLRQKKRCWCKNGQWVEGGKIWTYVPFTFLPILNRPILRSRFVIERSHQVTVPRVEKLLKQNGFSHADIVFLDEAVDYLLKLVPHKKSILRIHDDISYLFKRGFENCLQNQKKVIQNVDLVIVVSRLLEDKIKQMGAKNILYLPNAVDFEHFVATTDTPPPEYDYISRPRVVYVGALNQTFDGKLVERVASRLPNISFILIGKPITNLGRLTEFSNVHVLGVRDYGSLPKYLKNADVGMIPLKRTRRTEPVGNPNKLYMYMACGLPVVSIRFNEFGHIDTFAHLAEDDYEFAQRIEEATGEKERGKYVEFARGNTWGKRFEELMKVLEAEKRLG